MLTLIFIISIVLLTAALFVVRLQSRRTSQCRTETNPVNFNPESYEGIFAEQLAEEEKRREKAEADAQARHFREQLIERANKGDMSSLNDAYEKPLSQFPNLYNEVLNLVFSSSEKKFEGKLFVTEHIIESDKLRSSSDTASALISLWIESPERNHYVDILQYAALSDDGKVFLRAVDEVLNEWQGGKLPNVSSSDLIFAIESAYWLASSEVRCLGEGFRIKQIIADLRRQA